MRLLGKAKERAATAAPEPPYLHQLPPVLPKNSFFSEFQMNFFQLPSSLAFPRAMVAAQQWRPRPRVGECGARPGVLAAAAARCPPRPGSVSEGETRRCRCGSPSARRAAEQPRQSGRRGRCGGGGGRRDEGGGRARAGRLRAPHLAVGARPLAGSSPRSDRCPGGSANPAAAAPSRNCTTLPPVTSAETDRGQGGKVTGKDERSRARAPYTRARGPRAEKLAEGARPTFTIYRASATRSPAHRRHGGPIAGFEKAEPETRRGGRGAGTKEPTGLEGLARPRGRGEGLGAGELRSGCYARPLPPLAVPGHPPALVRWPAPASISGSPGDLGPFLASGTPPPHTHLLG